MGLIAKHEQIEAADPILLGGCLYYPIQVDGLAILTRKDVMDLLYMPAEPARRNGVHRAKATAPKPKHAPARRERAAAAAAPADPLAAYPQQLRDPRSRLARDIWDALDGEAYDIHALGNSIEAADKPLPATYSLKNMLFKMRKIGLLESSDDRPALWSRRKP